MDKQQAQQIIKDTFGNSFDKNRFARFIKDFLNGIDDAPFTYQGNYIPDAYKQYIKTLERIGKFSNGENSFDILVITLQKETSLERARTMQRNFIAWYLNGSRGGEMKDAALAAFVSPGEEDWRFSLVKMDYKFEKTKTGRMKVKEEFTPARRWSFLVGANEKSHTAQSRLVNILANDEQAPTLKEIEKAFDIETVTKEFFLKYRELFLRTKEELDRLVENDPKIKADFEKNGVDTVNFAKKLLGQIVFLYFLQKKGWFGVGRDDDWGTGSRHFLRELFERKHGNYGNFFNDILEPLFYDALRIDRSHDDGYYSHFNCKIPFLNGGLFDPIGNYDWVHTDILLPDRLFSNNEKTIEGDIGIGILDVFDRYNFTVKEDEPLEKEVAIDPELLGKAYEKFNAIRPDNFDDFKKALKNGKKGDENKFNKKFGVYYTPREIVHYMCQQSLINYLAIEPVRAECIPPVSKEDIETLIHTGDQVNENEIAALIKEQNIKEGKQKSSEYKSKLPESIRNNAKLIDDKLADITVCDPAVGSGAFPVGMMSEIIRTRNVLSVFIKGENRTSYEFKRRCIEHSLYGVDIDPGAVEIAKLRLWLSLVVDEDDINNIKPLPNLDYRIMQGNSLISEFMGITFDTEKEKNTENLMFKDETDEMIEHFQQKKDEFLNESNVTRKSKLKEEIDVLLIKIFETKLKTQKADYFKRLKEIEDKHSSWPTQKQRDEYIKQDKEELYKKSGFDLESAESQLKEFTSGKMIKPFFLWNLYFSEVFHNKGGFDVVIANPPYVRIQLLKKQNKKLVEFFKIHYKSARKGNYDLYVIFVELSHQLLAPTGQLAFILPHKFFNAQYGQPLRELIAKDKNLRHIVHFGDHQIFPGATNYVCLLFLTKAETKKCCWVQVDDLSLWFATGAGKEGQIAAEQISDAEWNFVVGESANLFKKLKNMPSKLGDVADIFVGLQTSADDVFMLNFISQTSKTITLQSKALECEWIFEKELFHPIVSGTDVLPFTPLPNRQFVLFPYHVKDQQVELIPMKTILDSFPKTAEYLKKNKRRLESRENDKLIGTPKWHGYIYLKNMIRQGLPKVCVPRLVEYLHASSDFDGLHYLDNVDVGGVTFNEVSSKHNLAYLSALLNSRLLRWFFPFVSAPFRGGFRSANKQFLSLIPFRPIDFNVSQDKIDHNTIVTLVERIIEVKRQNPNTDAIEFEQKIDQLVYKLYDMTKDEIAIIEGEKK